MSRIRYQSYRKSETGDKYLLSSSVGIMKKHTIPHIILTRTNKFICYTNISGLSGCWLDLRIVFGNTLPSTAWVYELSAGILWFLFNRRTSKRKSIWSVYQSLNCD